MTQAIYNFTNLSSFAINSKRTKANMRAISKLHNFSLDFNKPLAKR